MSVKLADYLDPERGVRALCASCSREEGLEPRNLGAALNTDVCERCGEKEEAS